MGKGTCKGAVLTEENDRVNTGKSGLSFPEDNDTQSHVEKDNIVQNDRDKQNSNLIVYQELIECNPNNMSLTKKVLTREMAMDMTNIRTANNDGLGNCVYVNVRNPNAKFPYCVSPDCYNTFADFYAEIIELIHGDPQDKASLIPEFGNLEVNAIVDLNSFNRKRSRTMYSEICVRRNIENIDFTPTITDSGRKKVISTIEEKIRGIFSSETEEALVPLTWDFRMEALKNDLDECGTMRDYPDDRMTLVFRNDDDVYEGCVLNFDDHIQYIASVNDGRLGLIFKEMFFILSAKSLSDINYTAHPIFGHLTLSPEHVGTGMKIRISAKFPFICRLADANFLIEEYDCIVENDPPNESTGIVFLTNQKTLNTTEYDIFRNIIMAYNKLCFIEDDLEATTAMAVQNDAMSSENLASLYAMIKDYESVSYTKKYFNEALASQFQDEKTNFGSSFNNCVRHNAFFPRSLYPRSCDSNCYVIFAKFFDPIILDSNGSQSFNHAKRPTYGSNFAEKRYRLRHSLIYSYRVRFNRNLERYPFPMMMSSKDRADVERIVVNCFNEIPVELEGEYFPFKTIKESIHYEDILKHRLIPNFCEVDVSAGFYRGWPKNRGIFIAKRIKEAPQIMLVILINVIDHIKVIAIDPTGKGLNICYERAISLMKFLDLKFEGKYAKKSGYGYLTSVPCFVGCAMRISALLKLKNLGDKRERLEKECINLQLVYRGSTGHGTVAERNVFDISMRINLNVTEQYILMMFIQKLKELLYIEREYNTRIEMPQLEEESLRSEDVKDFSKSKSKGSDESELESSIIEHAEDLPTVDNSKPKKKNPCCGGKK